jgi:signal transduction histidine kinase
VDGEGVLPAEVQVALYRIAQESLNNVVKHAQASSVRIKSRYSDGYARLEISDDGTGFRIDGQKPTSLGLRIMQERADAIGAELSVASVPRKGTQVVAEWHQVKPNEVRND